MAHMLPPGTIKSSPDTFVVQELVGKPAEPVPLLDESSVIGRGHVLPLTLFEMTKIGIEEQQAVLEIARQLRVSFSDIAFTGIKDKHAITTQRLAVKGNFYPRFEHTNIFLRQLTGVERLERHVGNHFSILVLVEDAFFDQLDLNAARQFPNFFGPQRVGRPGDEQAGKLFLEGKLEEAASAMMQSPARWQLRHIQRATRCSPEEAMLHESFAFSLKFEIDKWRSYLWNQLLSEEFEKAKSVIQIPRTIPMWSAHARITSLYRHLWPSVPERVPISTKKLIHPFSRPTVVKPDNLSATRKPKGWELTFDLPPGSYATVLLSQLFQLQ